MFSLIAATAISCAIGMPSENLAGRIGHESQLGVFESFDQAPFVEAWNNSNWARPALPAAPDKTVIYHIAGQIYLVVFESSGCAIAYFTATGAALKDLMKKAAGEGV